jgi:glycerophosphoryl diester phosphodiesterase
MRFLVALLIAIFGFGCSQNKDTGEIVVPRNFDWQGHRGARGLAPENTIPAFLKALEFPVKTLELDVVISKDSQVVLSHEPWMSAAICLKPDDTPIDEEEERQFNIFQLTWAEIQEFDCGSLRNERFPEQEPMAVNKPLLRDVAATVRAHCKANDREMPFYNIEIKSQPEWDNEFTPEPMEFARLLIDELKAIGIKDRTCIQSFDVRALQAAKEIDPDIVLALLVGNADGFEANVEALGFAPDVYSPNYALVTANLLEKAHEEGMEVIPWTVNDVETMQALIRLNVDGIITDYPNLIAEVEKE